MTRAALSRRQVMVRVIAMWLLAAAVQFMVIETKAWPYVMPEAWSEAKFFQLFGGFEQGIDQFGDVWRYPNGSFQETLLLRPDGHFYIKLESHIGVMRHAEGYWKQDEAGFYLLQQQGGHFWLRYKKQQSTHGCAYLLPMDKPSKKFMGLLAQGEQCDNFFGLKQPDADSEVFHDYHDATDEPWLIYLRCKKDKRDHFDALKPDEMKSSKADCKASEEGRLPH